MRLVLALTSFAKLTSSLSTMSTSSVIYPGFESAIDNDALKGKLFAVTGCTSGTGLVAAKCMAKKGAAHVFLLNRPSPRAEAALTDVKAVAAEKDAQTPEDGAVPLLTCCLATTVKSGEFYEPEHTSRGPAKLTQLEPTSLEADRAALWSASEAAIGEKWEL